MGLLQNGYRQRLTHKVIGATNQDNANASVQVYQGHRTAANRNMLTGEGISSKLAGVPDGNLAPSAWILPYTGGRMSSRAASLAVDALGQGIMGMPGTGSASFSIVFADADGQLIVSGSGSAGMVFSTNTPLLTASINGIGSASFTITGEQSILGALADLVGTTSFSFSTTADILPEDDDSPLRTASAVFSFGGSLTSYAIGHMEGTTDVQTELTADGIASALWNADASLFNASGTMGNKLNTASSGGVDLNALADAVWSAAEATHLTDSAEFLAKIATNKRAIVQEASGWALVVYDDDGTTPILQKALKDKTGGAIADLGAGVLAQEEASTI
jgi:hypothetical protein